MSYETYKIIHLIGVFLVLTSLTGILALRMAGPELPPRGRKLFFAAHGAGLLIVLVAGFGMLARLQLMASLPGWAYGKLVVWLILGGSIALAKRKGHLGGGLFALFIALGAIAAWLAIAKPF